MNYPSNLAGTKRNQAKKRAILQAIKMERGCADCGYNAHPAALDFDHRPGEVKMLLLGRNLSNYGIERLLAEVEKCDVVCANCHRIRTSERGQHIVMGPGSGRGKRAFIALEYADEDVGLKERQPCRLVAGATSPRTSI